MKTILSALSLSIILSGCAAPDNKTYDKEGRESHSLTCGMFPGACYSKADEICPKGYYLVDKDINGITVRCK